MHRTYVMLVLLAVPALVIGQHASPGQSHVDSSATTEISGPTLTVTQRASPIPAHADLAALTPLASIERQLVELRVDMAQAAKRSAPDPTHFCYLGDKAYSEGAVVDHQECARNSVNVSDVEPALRWTIH